MTVLITLALALSAIPSTVQTAEEPANGRYPKLLSMVQPIKYTPGRKCHIRDGFASARSSSSFVLGGPITTEFLKRLVNFDNDTKLAIYLEGSKIL